MRTLFMLLLAACAVAAAEFKPLNVEHNGRLYSISKPDVQLWTFNEIRLSGRWPTAHGTNTNSLPARPVLLGRAPDAVHFCTKVQARGDFGDYTNRNFLVVCSERHGLFSRATHIVRPSTNYLTRTVPGQATAEELAKITPTGLTPKASTGTASVVTFVPPAMASNDNVLPIARFDYRVANDEYGQRYTNITFWMPTQPSTQNWQFAVSRVPGAPFSPLARDVSVTNRVQSVPFPVMGGTFVVQGASNSLSSTTLVVKSIPTSGSDFGYATASDSGGNLLTAGSQNGFGFAARHSADGILIWSNRFTGGIGAARAIGVDAQSNVFVAGNFFGTTSFDTSNLTSAGGLDLFVAKFSTNGTVLWAKSVGGSVGDDSARALSVTPQGDVVLCGTVMGAVNFGGGTTTGGDFETDIAIAKYSGATGAHQWSKRLVVSGTDEGAGIAVDRNGNVIVVGNYSGTVNFGVGAMTSSGVDGFIVKYNSAGTPQWSKRFGSALRDEARAVACDTSGNIFVAGLFTSTVAFGSTNMTSAGGRDSFLWKLNPSGSNIWSKRFGNAGDFDTANAVAVDISGSATLGGSFVGAVDFGTGSLSGGGSLDAFTVKVSSSGNVIWARAYGSSNIDEVLGISTDWSGSVLMAGRYFGTVDFGGTNQTSAGSGDAFLLKLAP